MTTVCARFIFLAIMVVAPTMLRAGDELSKQDHAKLEDAGKRVEMIAAALKSYAGDNEGKLPRRLHLLVPKYLKSPDALQIPHLITSLPKEIPAYPVWMHGAGIEDPDDENQSMIAFTPGEFPGGGRYIIDARFQIWFCGEGRFQDWIHGRKFDDEVVEEVPCNIRSIFLDPEFPTQGVPKEAWTVRFLWLERALGKKPPAPR